MCVQQWAGPRHSRFRSEDILALQYMMWSFLSSNATVLHRTPEFPLQVLQEAIATRDEMKVWKVLRKQRIRDELVHSTTTHKVPSDPQQHKYNVFTCVEAAVHCDTPRVILAMFRYNPADVRLATWYALYRLKTVKVSPELVDLARAQRRAWLWDRIGAFVLLRQCKMPTSRRQEGEVGALHPLAAIPDEAFRIIVSFVDLHERKEARILQFLIEARPCPICSRLCIPGHCKANAYARWSDELPDEARLPPLINHNLAPVIVTPHITTVPYSLKSHF